MYMCMYMYNCMRICKYVFCAYKKCPLLYRVFLYQKKFNKLYQYSKTTYYSSIVLLHHTKIYDLLYYYIALIFIIFYLFL